MNGLIGCGALSGGVASAALGERRRALLEADVALKVVRSFTDKVSEKAVDAKIMKSIEGVTELTRHLAWQRRWS